MEFKKIFLLSFILTVCFTGIFSSDKAYTSSISAIESMEEDVVTHVVVKGETIYSIAADYHTTVQQLYKLNPKAEKGIKTGDKLLVPRVKIISGYTNHVIEAKETLFSLARVYNMSIDDIKRANPGLDENTFSAGKTIKLPFFVTSDLRTVSKNGTERVSSKNMTYKVQKGDTLYGISKKYNVSVETLFSANTSLKDSGLKEGMILNIPQKQIERVMIPDSRESVSRSDAPFAGKGETVKVGILLPFSEEGGSIQKDKLTEYYEGFLLAVRALKEKGLNAEIYTFDIGKENDTNRLESLLGTNELQNLHLVIGGVSKKQIDALARFSKKTGIKYVTPFGSTTDIDSNSNVFRMTNSHSSLYPEVYNAFIKRFSNYNIIFVSEVGSDNNKSDFANNLKKELSKSGLKFKAISGSENLLTDIKNVLDTSGKNIIVPTSSSESTLRKITAMSNMLSTASISFFGYPEWQAYAHRTNDLHKFDSYIFSIFFLNEQQREVQEFSTQFKYWYNKSLISSYPKWGYLGYDTGLYFLTALRQYGSGFDSNIGSVQAPTLQSAVYFERVNSKSGGCVNNGIYFIHYRTDSSIEKIDISK